tara:strand:+ start:14705 stop:15181 length:477 start_codon:yes stop_codon:yes gene_type:complete
MANSDLYGNKWTVPNNVITKLNKELNKTDTSVSGYKRAKNIVSDRTMTYSMLKRMKNFFDAFSGNKNSSEYLLNGGDAMKTWVNNTLNNSRGDIVRNKRNKSDSGMNNQFKKTHSKDKNNKNVTKSSIAIIKGDSRSIKNNRAVYKEMTQLINKLIKN